jgi:hypothetical protein
MAEPTHREQAEDLLALALAYPPQSPTRLAYLAEAQVHASLAVVDATTPPPTATPSVSAVTPTKGRSRASSSTPSKEESTAA